MTAREVTWRLTSALRDLMDTARVMCGFEPSRRASHYPDVGFSSLLELAPAETERTTVCFERNDAWRRDLVDKANSILGHRLSYFDLKDIDLGDPIDWHLDRCSNVRAPVKPIQFIDYRDVATAGDCKLVWEPNRHHQLVVLARAYHATRDERYARAVIQMIDSWLDANPYGKGMNWRNPLELGIRLINWSWALSFVKDANFGDEKTRPVLESVFNHCWDVRRKYSQESSANNHLIGEAAGVFVASCTFSSLLDLDAWRDEAAAILEREILAQTYQDGCNREHAFAYHLFVTQFFVVCLAVARKAGISFSRDYVARLREMIDFAISIMAASHSMPKLGDSDDAYVLDLGDRNDDFDALLAQYAFVSNDALPGSLRRVPECAYWLGGQPLIERLRAEMEKPKPTALLESRGFEASGYYLLQNPEGADAPAMSVLADCAELGFGSIAAHGHADALSFVLRAFGRDVLVDSGTYDYFTYPEWRRYFKSTAAHNTIRIDGQNQSEVLGPFLWGKRARVDVVEWSKADDRIELKARHDGYTQLRNPVTHTRTFLLEPNKLCVTDELDGNGARDVEIFFHFAPDWVVELDEQGVVEARHGACRVELRIDSRLTCECVIGDEKRPAGWFSAGYHQKVPTATVIGTGRLALPVVITSQIHCTQGGDV